MSHIDRGRRVVFDAPRTGWVGVSHGPHVNLHNDVLYDLIEVEFDREPGMIYLCKRSLLESATDDGHQVKETPHAQGS